MYHVTGETQWVGCTQWVCRTQWVYLTHGKKDENGGCVAVGQTVLVIRQQLPAGSADVGEGLGRWQPRLAAWQRRGQRPSSFLDSDGVSSSSPLQAECRRAGHTQAVAGPQQAHTRTTARSHTALFLLRGCRDFDRKPGSIFGCEMSRSCLCFISSLYLNKFNPKGDTHLC